MQFSLKFIIIQLNIFKFTHGRFQMFKYSNAIEKCCVVPFE